MELCERKVQDKYAKMEVIDLRGEQCEQMVLGQTREEKKSGLVQKAMKYKEQAKFEVKALVQAEKYLEGEVQRLEAEQVQLDIDRKKIEQDTEEMGNFVNALALLSEQLSSLEGYERLYDQCSTLSTNFPSLYSKNTVSEHVAKRLLDSLDKWQFTEDCLLHFDLFLTIRNILTLTKAQLGEDD